MDLSLSPELEELVRRKVKSGDYNSDSEVVAEALWLLDAMESFREIRLTQLRTEIQKGLDSGPPSELDFGEIKAKGRKRLAERLGD